MAVGVKDKMQIHVRLRLKLKRKLLRDKQRPPSEFLEKNADPDEKSSAYKIMRYLQNVYHPAVFWLYWSVIPLMIRRKDISGPLTQTTGTNRKHSTTWNFFLPIFIDPNE